MVFALAYSSGFKLKSDEMFLGFFITRNTVKYHGANEYINNYFEKVKKKIKLWARCG